MKFKILGMVNSLVNTVFLCSFIFTTLSFGEVAAINTPNSTAVDTIFAKVDSTSKPKAPQKWAVVPALISTAETGVQVGALVIRFLNPGDTLNKPSSAGFAIRLSQKKQVEFNLFQESYLKQNAYHLVTALNFISWPAYFYGVGNNSDIEKDSADFYTSQGMSGDITFEKQVWPKLFVGPQALFNYESIETDAKHGLLNDKVVGYSGAFTDGAGGVITYDNRDAIYWTRTGNFLRAKAAWYRDFMGSESEYDAYSFEARQFIPVATTGALGASAILQLKTGEIPFRELSTANGDKAMRGMVRGKYRDRHLLVFQTEFKSYFPDWSFLQANWIRNRLGYAVFAEAGQVAHEVEEIALDEFRPGFGFGLRYAMNPVNRMNFRLDIGIVDGHVAPAINFKEAF